MKMLRLSVVLFAAISCCALALAQPVITTQPQAVTVAAGQSATFSVTATGTAPLNYQWKKDGVDIAGATSATLALTNVQSAGSADYAVVVSNGLGNVTSVIAKLSLVDYTPYAFTTAAGTSPYGSDDGTGTAAKFRLPSGIAVDPAGNTYVADRFNHTIRKITPMGAVTTLAGSVGVIGSADGTGAAARFSYPDGVTVDAAGNLLVADAGNNTIRRITPEGVVSTIAGGAGNYGSADGAGSAARFGNPSRLAVDSAGNIYVTDAGNHTIRRITPTGVVTTLAGTAASYGSTDGTGGTARFNTPGGLAIDSTGNLYVGDRGNHTIRKISPTGAVTTLAGSAGQMGNVDGTGDLARFNRPTGVAVDSAGIIYVTDTDNRTIRKITPAGNVSTLAGDPEGAFRDGAGTAARFQNPEGVAVDGAGNLYVADTSNSLIRRVTPTGVVSTWAGFNGSWGSGDGTGTAARFNQPGQLGLDGAGNLYVAEFENYVIRKITPAGVTSTLAGLAGVTGSVNGTGSSVRFDHPQGIAVDGAGNLLVADCYSHVIRRVEASGVVSTLAGLAYNPGSADGTGSSARFRNPRGIGLDGAGNLLVADASNHTIRKITPAGVVTTLAGSAGQAGSADGLGGSARFREPWGLTVDGEGNVVVADTQNNTIRRITPAGVVSTVAGAPGMSGLPSDGVGSAARFSFPCGVAVDSAGYIYVSENSLVRRISSGGVVTTLAGRTFVPGCTDGIGANALFTLPWGMVVSGAGTLYVADTLLNTIRQGWLATAPAIGTQPVARTATTGQTVTFTVAATGDLIGYQWRKNGLAIAGATSATLTLSNVQVSDVAAYSVTVTNSLGSVTSNAVTLSGSSPVPTVTAQPQNVTVTSGQSATLTVAATGSGPLTYQWRRSGFAIGGATSASFNLAGALMGDAGVYDVAVADGLSTTISSAALLGIMPATNPPGVELDPAFDLQLENELGGTANVVVPYGTGGQFLVGGDFVRVNGIAARRLVRCNADGVLDGTFAASFNFAVSTLLVQPDNKVVVGGSFTLANGVQVGRIVRLNPDGTLDETANPGGSAANGGVLAMVRQADGKIIIGGSFTSYNGSTANRIARLNSDLTLDPTFLVGSSQGVNGTVNALALDPVSGKVVLGGTFTTHGVTSVSLNRIARFNPDGTNDTTFALGAGFNNSVNALGFDPTSSVLVGGAFTAYNGVSGVNRLVRLTALGAIDTTFNYNPPSGTGYTSVPTIAFSGGGGTGATATATFNSTTGQVTGITVTNGGTGYTSPPSVTFSGGAGSGATANAAISGGAVTAVILAAGPGNTVSALAYDSANARWLVGGSFTNYNGGATFNRLLRVSATGVLDAAFNPNVNNTVRSVFVRSSDSAVVLGGSFTNVGNQAVASIKSIARVTAPAGALDLALIPPTFRGSGNVNAMLALPAGRVLIAGVFTHSGATVVGNVARLNANLTVDPTFNAAGSGANGTVNTAVLQGDGRIVIGGTFTTYNGTTMNRLARLNVDGTLDPTFAVGSGLNNTVNTLTGLPGGRLLVGGTFTSFNGVTRASVVRLNADGTLDYGLNAGATSFTVYALGAQTDGKIVVGGSFTTVNGVSKTNLARLNSDGTVDTTFNSGTGPGSQVRAVLIQPTGKILIGGDFTTYNGATTTRLAQLNSDGTLDSTFAVGTSLNNYVSSISRLGDGKLMATGGFWLVNSLTNAYLVARFNTDGAYDPTFAHVTNSSANWFINLPAMQSLVLDDGTVLVGSFSFSLFNQDRFGVVHLRAVNLPTITTQPQSVIATAGTPASFSVTGTGGNTLAYQWFKDGTEVVGATANALAFTSVQPADSGIYTLRVTNGLGSVTSSPVTLSGANPFPTITTQPVATTAPVGGNTSLSVAATGTGALAYQWRKFGVPIAGATSATLNLSGLGLDAAGYYDVLVSDGLSARASSAAQLTVAPTAYPGALLPRAGFEPRVELVGIVFKFAPLADGRFYASGSFTTIDGVAREGIARFLSDGSLDASWTPTFIGGTVGSIAVQADEKIVIGGTFIYVGGVNSFRLARLNANGSVDPSFNLGSGFSGGNVNAVAIQPDQKIVVAGAFTSVNGYPANRIVRLNSDGSPDATFNIGTGFDNSVNALVLQPDGGIVVVGSFTNFNGAIATRIARLTAAGAIDGTFVTGAGFDVAPSGLVFQPADNKIVAVGSFTKYNNAASVGIARLSSTGTRDAAIPGGTGFLGGGPLAVAVQSNGDLVVGGTFTSYNGSNAIRLARLAGATGALDPALNATLGVNGVNATVRHVAIQAVTGQILAGGPITAVNTTVRSGLIRFNPDGTLDSVNRLVLEPGQVFAVQPVANGKFVIGGIFSSVGGTPINSIARLDATGALDPTFNPGSGAGLVGGGFGAVRAIAQQGDGKLVIGGNFTAYNGVTSGVNRIARISADGVLDAAFATAIGTGFNSTQVNAIVLEPDGRIIVGGTFTALNGVSVGRIACLGPTGAPDIAFTTANGTAFNTNTGGINALVVQPDGKIIAGGVFVTFDGTSTNSIARLLPGGGLDPTFLVGPGFALGAGLSGTLGVTSLALQPDGKILAGGFFGSYGGAIASNLVRLLPTGAIDYSFASGSGLSNMATALALQPDGKIIVAGSFTTVGGQRRGGLARLTSTGALDLAFGVAFEASTPTTTVNTIVPIPDGSLLLGSSAHLHFVDRVTGGLVLLENGPTPAIIGLPYGGAYLAGSTTNTLAVTAAGTGALTYQWKRNGVALIDLIGDVLGTKTNVLSFENAQSAHAGNYTVTITDATSSVTTPAVTVTIIAAAPVISGDPITAFGSTMQAGSATYLAVTATGSAPITATWTKDGVALTGGYYNGGMFYQPITPAKPSDAGVYQVTLTNSLGTVTSPPCRLWVTEESGWTPHNPLPSPQGLTKISVSNGNFLATGIRGARFESVDGMAWNQLPNLGQNNLTGYLEGNGRKLLVGSLGFFALSIDGNTWKTAALPTLEAVQGSAFGAGLFVVASSYAGSASSRGKIFSSPDGEVWTERYSISSQHLYSIAYGNGAFATFTAGGILRSPDGIAWTLQSGSPTTGSVIQFVNGQFILIGSDNLLYVSADAITWSSRPYGSSGASAVTYANGQYVLTGLNGLLLTSADALTWLRRTTGTTTNLRGAAFNNGTWVVISNQSFPANILTSTDNGATWTSRLTSVTYNKLNALASDGTSSIVAVGEPGTILRSSDGSGWSAVSSGTTSSLAGVAYGAGKYVAVGSGGRILTSPTGAAWTSVTSGTTSNLHGLFFANNLFLAAAESGAILYSSDGITWASVTPPGTSQIDGCAFGAGRYVAVGNGGLVITSTDAATWAPAVSGTTANLEGVAYGNGRFLIAGAGTVLTSTDGLAWTALAPPELPNWVSGTIFLNGQFYAGAGSNSFLTSADGLTWSGHHLGINYADIDGGVAVYQGRLYFSGNYGMIISAAFAPSVTQQPAGQVFTTGSPVKLSVLAAGTPLGVTYQWRRNGANIAGATSATFAIASAQLSDAGSYDVVIANSAGFSTSQVAVIAPVGPPTITTQPGSRLASVDTGTIFTVAATGAGPLGYQWKKDGVALADGGRISGSTTAVLSLGNLILADGGNYTVVVTNGSGTVTSSVAGLTVIDALATHAVVGPGYNPGGTVTITQTITYVGTATALEWKVLLPTGWSYVSDGGAAGDQKPVAGSTRLLEWAWTSGVPASPVAFSYMVNVPANQTGDVSIVALADARLQGITGALQILATPDPLVVRQIVMHSADEDRNFRISLLELTRVIELYNTRNGTIRTGCYGVQTGTEDGFALDPARAGGTVVTLARYHSADENRDGKLSLVELTRMIELYNTRSGTTRTGAYHVQAGTEDGFAPGP